MSRPVEYSRGDIAAAVADLIRAGVAPSAITAHMVRERIGGGNLKRLEKIIEEEALPLLVDATPREAFIELEFARELMASAKAILCSEERALHLHDARLASELEAENTALTDELEAMKGRLNDLRAAKEDQEASVTDCLDGFSEQIGAMSQRLARLETTTGGGSPAVGPGKPQRAACKRRRSGSGGLGTAFGRRTACRG